MTKQNWLEVTEYIFIAASAVGTINAVLTQQVVYAAAPLTIAVALSAINRRKVNDNTVIIAQMQQLIVPISQRCDRLSELVKRIETQTEQKLDSFYQSDRQQNQVSLAPIEQKISLFSQDLTHLQVQLQQLAQQNQQDIKAIKDALFQLQSAQKTSTVPPTVSPQYRQERVNSGNGNASTSSQARSLDEIVEQIEGSSKKAVDDIGNSLNHFFGISENSHLPQANGLPKSLVSSLGIDYRKLRDLLTAKQWKAADVETRNLMLKVVSREQESKLNADAIAKLPCEDLRIVDCLWRHYSQGRFGFSVQKSIYESCSNNYDNFGQKVQWKMNTNWLNYSDLNFAADAPIGHLPLGALVTDTNLGWFAFEWNLLFSRMESCQLST